MRSIESIATLIGVTFGIIIFSLVFTFARVTDLKRSQESYQAWIKQTGNPKDLTFDEFVALSRTGFFGPK